MSRLRDKLIYIIHKGVPINVHCPDCLRYIAAEKVIDMSDSSDKLWDSLIKKVLEAIVDQLKEDIK